MEALIEPVDNIRRRVKWGLAIHTTALFLFLTIHTTMDLRLLSIGYIDNRNFPGTGPLGHDDSANFSTAFVVIYTVMFPLSQWLVDGFLVSRLHFNSLMCLTRFILPVISLLCYLFHGLLGHDFPMSDVCCFSRYVPNLFAVLLWRRPLTHKYSDGHREHLQHLAWRYSCAAQHRILFNLPFTQYPSYAHDYHKTCPA